MKYEEPCMEMNLIEENDIFTASSLTENETGGGDIYDWSEWF